MARHPARITQQEIARTIRAAKQAGAAEIEVRIGDQASIIIRLMSTGGPTEAIAANEEIVL
jgi:hypothetical protein